MAAKLERDLGVAAVLVPGDSGELSVWIDGARIIAKQGAKFPEPGQAPNPRPIDHEFNTVQGVHDIHMNQGNPPGSLGLSIVRLVENSPHRTEKLLHRPWFSKESLISR